MKTKSVLDVILALRDSCDDTVIAIRSLAKVTLHNMLLAHAQRASVVKNPEKSDELFDSNINMAVNTMFNKIIQNIDIHCILPVIKQEFVKPLADNIFADNINNSLSNLFVKGEISAETINSTGIEIMKGVVALSAIMLGVNLSTAMNLVIDMEL